MELCNHILLAANFLTYVLPVQGSPQLFRNGNLTVDSVQWVNEAAQVVSFAEKVGMHTYVNTCESVHIINPVRDKGLVLLDEFLQLQCCEEEQHILLPRFEAFAIKLVWHQSLSEHARYRRRSLNYHRTTCGS